MSLISFSLTHFLSVTRCRFIRFPWAAPLGCGDDVRKQDRQRTTGLMIRVCSRSLSWRVQNLQKKSLVSFSTPHKPVEFSSPKRDRGVTLYFPVRQGEKEFLCPEQHSFTGPTFPWTFFSRLPNSSGCPLVIPWVHFSSLLLLAGTDAVVFQPHDSCFWLVTPNYTF